MLRSQSAHVMHTPLGLLAISGTDAGVRSIAFQEDGEAAEADAECLRACAVQLQEYFAKTRKAFSGFPLAPVGTDFQQRVWDGVSLVPWGETVTYGTLASDIGDPGAARAVGTALGRNPLCILVPCHRVITMDGNGGGYAWGQWRKDWLLQHESSST